MGQLSIALFGPLRVTLDEAPLTGLYSDKARALLAYLAVEHDRPHRRESLAGLLWPEYAERSARHSLSQALHNLRWALDQATAGTEGGLRLSASAQTIALTGTAGCVDAADFCTLLESCETHAHSSLATCPACRERLQRAVALYTGDLLAGFSLPDSPAFEEWLLLQRERTRRMAVDALRVLASAEATDADDAQLSAGRRWVEMEPLDDAARRALMRALALGGHRGAALAQFERFEAALRDEIGVAPEPATAALAQRIQSGALSAGAAAPDASPAPRVVSAQPEVRQPPRFFSGPERYLPPLFVARERELAQLKGHLEAALAGQPRVVFVTGEPGSGKTALLREFRQRALGSDADLVTAVGHCNAQTGFGDPYLAFRELLAQLGGEVEARWAAGAISGEQARRLWGLAPETAQALAEGGPDLVGTLVSVGPLLERARAAAPAAPWVAAGVPWLGTLERLASDWQTRGGDQLQQTALFSQVTAVLQRLARRRPLLLVLEDLHWSDAGTVALLFHLGCHLEGDRVLIVGSYRPAEVLAAAPNSAVGDARHPLLPVVHEFARRYGEIEVDLDRADGRRFVDALIDSEPNTLGSDFRTTLLQQCDGNALFTVEILRELQERGCLVRDARGHWVETSSQDWSSLPARVEGVLAERIGRLAPPLQEALRVASVEGETFTVEVLARILGRVPRGVVGWLSGDLDRTHRLVSPLETPSAGSAAQGRYRFRHILVQNYVYGTLDAVERAYLHRAVGDALRELHGGRAVEIALELARHYEQARVPEQAAAYLQQAGDNAVQLSAYQDAVAHYGRGIALLEALPQTRETLECELGLRLGLAQALQATVGYAAPASAEACEGLRALSLQLGETPQLVQALMLLNTTYGTRGDYAGALEIGRKAVEVAQRAREPALIAVTRAALGWLDVSTGDYAQALADMGQILTLNETQPDLVVRDYALGYWAVNALSWAAIALATQGYADQGRARSRQCLELARRIGRNHDICHALSVACSVFHTILREFETALEWANEEVRLATEKGDPSYQAMGSLHRGQAMSHLGRATEGIALMQQTMGFAELIGFRAYAPYYLGGLAEAYAAAGQMSEALEAAERGLALGLEMSEGMSIPDLYIVRGTLRLQADPPDFVGAEADLVAAIDYARRQEARLYELRAAVALGRLWLSQRRTEDARALVQPVYDWFTEGFDLRDLVEARELLETLASKRPHIGLGTGNA